jgi:hypothetical protein
MQWNKIRFVAYRAFAFATLVTGMVMAAGAANKWG